MQGNISSVEIKTGEVSGTNFDISRDEVSFLLDSGRAAVRDFIQNEHANLTDSLAFDIARYGEDELFDDLVREMMTPGKRLVVSCTDTAWYWRLFPSVAHWMFAGAEVDILVKAASDSVRENQRREILQKMGARVIETSQIPFNCFLLSREDDRYNAAFILDVSATEHSPKGVVYIGTKHRPMIRVLLEGLDRLLGSDNSRRPELTLKESDPTKLIARLKKGVHQYDNPDVTIEMQEVSLRQETSQPIEMIVRRVRSFKYRQIAHLVSLYNKYGIPFCMPADINANGQYVSTVTPPVIEEWGDKLVAVEGNTRIYYLNRIGVESIHSLLVKGVVAPLPGRPTDLRKVLVSTYHLPSKERISGFTYDNFRSIEGAARPETVT
jgi:hypothetical protein